MRKYFRWVRDKRDYCIIRRYQVKYISPLRGYHDRGGSVLLKIYRPYGTIITGVLLFC